MAGSVVVCMFSGGARLQQRIRHSIPASRCHPTILADVAVVKVNICRLQITWMLGMRFRGVDASAPGPRIRDSIRFSRVPKDLRP